MTAPTVGAEATAYLRRVRAALADLPKEDREELIDELAGHLAEIASELDAEGATLESRLGPPEAYAAELRTSAGLASAPSAAGSADRLRADWARFKDNVDELPGTRWLRAFLPELRPGWWVLRGYCLAVVVAAMMGARFDGVWPEDFVAGWAFLFFAPVAMFFSVWLGRRSSTLVQWQRLVIGIASAFVLIGAFAVVSSHRGSDYSSGYAASSPMDDVTDLRVYGPDGNLVRNAQVFDQNGNPVELYGDCPWATPTRADGSAATNVYPRVPDPSAGACDPATVPVPEREPGLLTTPTAPTPTAPTATPPTATPPTPTPPTPTGPTSAPLTPGPTGPTTSATATPAPTRTP